MPNWMPGPWKVVARPGELNESCWIGPKNHELVMMSIAEVRNGANDPEYGGPKTQLANANLIAAAPELYQALKAAQEELRLIHMKDTGAVYNPALRTQIAVALQKAEVGDV